MDALFLSDRILISSDEGSSLVSGGVLVCFADGTIKRIFTSQEEINSWLFIDHGGDVRKYLKENSRSGFSWLSFRCTISGRKLSCPV